MDDKIIISTPEWIVVVIGIWLILLAISDVLGIYKYYLDWITKKLSRNENK